MKLIVKAIVIGLFVLTLACNKSSVFSEQEQPINGTMSMSDRYRFFPQKDGNHWYHSNAYYDSLGNRVDSFVSKSVYSKDSGVINIYRGNASLGWMRWQTTSGAIRCCNGVIIVSFYNLDCKSDSILVEIKTDLPSRKSYQYCLPVYFKNLLNYEKVKCIHAKQINTNKDGTRLVIDRYFGFDVGLLCKIETYYAADGVQRSKVVQKLLSHRF